MIGRVIEEGGQQNCFPSIKKILMRWGIMDMIFGIIVENYPRNMCLFSGYNLTPKNVGQCNKWGLMRSLWVEQKYEPVHILSHDLSNSIEIWIVYKYKFTCRCEADYVDRNCIHFETRESQNVPPVIHNGRFRHLNPPNNISFEILRRFCSDEAIKKKEEGKDFWMQYSVYLPLPDAWQTQRGRKKSFFSKCNPLPIFLF